MSITRAQAITLGNEIDAAVSAICEKYGMAKGRTSGKYGDTYKYSVELTEVALNESGVNLASKEATDFVAMVPMLGWATKEAAQEAIGSTFTSAGREFTFLGYKPRSTKRPVLAKGPDGKNYVFNGIVLRQLKGYDSAFDAYRQAS